MEHPADPPTPLDAHAQHRLDRRRLRRALWASGGFVGLLWLVLFAQQFLPWRSLAVQPQSVHGLWGLLGAPLLHGGFEHLLANSIALLMLGTLAMVTVPGATVRALPLLWLGSGLGAWLLGEAGSYHVGASGVTHGLMFLIFTLGLLRRDRAAVAAGLLAFFFYGGMLLTILPREAGVSWQAHLGGAVAGVIAAFLFRRIDPPPARRVYSWELEDEDGEADDADALELPRPVTVPVIWHRPDDSATDDHPPQRTPDNVVPLVPRSGPRDRA
ncbi:MAG: rhomboid family intramembrane serine protease [Pseudoxanthomonas suwonensis]|nr:rhomboid family intramembrane serine protease [Pseudoxanthomonas suwonensis]